MFLSRCIPAVLIGMALALPCRAEEAAKPSQDFSDTDQSKRDFSGKQLPGANFENCKLFLANFTEANLQKANFHGANLTSATLTRAKLQGADLHDAQLHAAGLQDTQLQKANLSGADMTGTGMQSVNLTGADLRNLKGLGGITFCNFTGADLRGANFENAIDYNKNSAIFTKAKYDRRTRWPVGFDPEAAGAILVKIEPKAKPVEEEDDPPAKPKVKPPKTSDPKNADEDDSPPKRKPKPAAPASTRLTVAELEKLFKEKDKNGDGILSGKEMRAYKEFDADSDGEVTKAEFVEGHQKKAKSD